MIRRKLTDHSYVEIDDGVIIKELCAAVTKDEIATSNGGYAPAIKADLMLKEARKNGTLPEHYHLVSVDDTTIRRGRILIRKMLFLPGGKYRIRQIEEKRK